jgi:uncharacterized ion transporter superfamily protein YfcC
MEQVKTVKEKSFSNIGVRSFVIIVILLSVIILFSGALSYFIPQGSFQYDENGNIIPDSYVKGEIKGIAIWRILTAPVRVYASEDALTIIMISVFLLIMSGVFNILEKTNGIRVFIGRLIHRLANRGGPVVCVCVLIFMLFGSFFGMFEELCTLIPLVVVLMLSMGMDTMTGLGACMLAACFGFSAAITNPFSVGLASELAGSTPTDGMWLRIVFFFIIYLVLCAFLMLHIRNIEKDPMSSLTYESDLRARDSVTAIDTSAIENSDKIFKVYSVFFAVQMVVLVLIASIRAISGLAIPILSVTFLVGGIVCGMLVCEEKGRVLKQFLNGAGAMLPAVIMIAMASSVKLIMTESGIMDTVMNIVIKALEGKGKFTCILLIYALILFLQIFIGSASAKIMLVVPIVAPICATLGISPAFFILVYCMADGFTDMIIPTNPVLLVGLSMANVSYTKWVKWIWKLQVLVFAITIGILAFASAIGY